MARLIGKVTAKIPSDSRYTETLWVYKELGGVIIEVTDTVPSGGMDSDTLLVTSVITRMAFSGETCPSDIITHIKDIAKKHTILKSSRNVKLTKDFTWRTSQGETLTGLNVANLKTALA